VTASHNPISKGLSANAVMTQAITACLAAGDDAQAAELAHKLAGAAGMHGFTPIGEAARHLESLLRRGDRSALDETIGSLRTLCARARAA
jgi:HPt (histidine-containing phosphotransfer) domain-containing protein